LPSERKALGSVPSSEKKKKKKDSFIIFFKQMESPREVRLYSSALNGNNRKALLDQKEIV